MQLAFYGSTPNYAFLFDQLGAAGTTTALREHQKAGDLAGMAEVVGDDLLAEFVVEGTWDSLAGALVDRYVGLASRLVLYFANPSLADGVTMARFGEVARRIEGRA